MLFRLLIVPALLVASTTALPRPHQKDYNHALAARSPADPFPPSDSHFSLQDSNRRRTSSAISLGLGSLTPEVLPSPPLGEESRRAADDGIVEKLGGSAYPKIPCQSSNKP